MRPVNEELTAPPPEAGKQEFAAQPLKDQLHSMRQVSDGAADWMIAYLYDHFDAFKLIACHASGTRYGHSIDTLIEIESASGRRLIDRMREAGMPAQELDDGLIHILFGALFNGIFETIRHDMPRGAGSAGARRLPGAVFLSRFWQTFFLPVKVSVI